MWSMWYDSKVSCKLAQLVTSEPLMSQDMLLGYVFNSEDHFCHPFPAACFVIDGHHALLHDEECFDVSVVMKAIGVVPGAIHSLSIYKSGSKECIR